MICSACRNAGALNSQAQPGMPNTEKLIKSMHSDCPGGNWCDCHHFVGQALNLTLVTAATEDARADVLEPVELCT